MAARFSTLTLARALDTVLAATVLAQRERVLAMPRSPSWDAEDDPAPVLRENLRAASQHIALGHESASFRDCPHPACQDAASLIPLLETVEEEATDAELDVIFDRVQAALEAGAYGDVAPEPAAGEDAVPSPPSPTSR